VGRVNAKPPAAVRLIGQRFAIESVAANTLAKSQVGLTNVAKQRIALSDGMAPDQTRDTLLHEILHALIRMLGLIASDAKEERVVIALAPALLDALRANPGLVAYLVAE
jgi:hypothetical protein